MKRSLLLALPFIAALSFPAAGQDQAAHTRTVVVDADPTAAAAAASAPRLIRFDLDFPGGTPAQLAAAISQATKTHLNLIIPDERKDTKIMPIKVEEVTLPDLFEAIKVASQHTMTVPTGPSSSRIVDAAIAFKARSGSDPDNTVWSFMATGPTTEELAIASALQENRAGDANSSPTICQYFQLSSYLEDHTIEDITTAIQTGWKMLKVDPLPQLSFHKETKLLIAVGPETQVGQILQVLSQLRMDSSNAVDKVARLQAEIAELEAKKEAGWEGKMHEKYVVIGEIVNRQKAREALDGPARRVIRPSTGQ